MGDEDESAADEDEGPRRKPRARVTLSLSPGRLSLPGEATDDLTDGPPSQELAIPEGVTGLGSVRSRPEPPPPEELPGGLDGWSRQRPRLTPSPMRAVSEVPAPPLHAPLVGAGEALSLVESHARPSSAGVDLETEMHERYALDDFTAALGLAELMLGRDPEHVDARAICEDSRERLVAIYASRVGPLKKRPRLRVSAAEIRWLGLDNRAGFLLSRIDGKYTVEELIDVAGMPRLDTLRILAELLDAEAVELA